MPNDISKLFTSFKTTTSRRYTSGFFAISSHMVQKCLAGVGMGPASHSFLAPGFLRYRRHDTLVAAAALRVMNAQAALHQDYPTTTISLGSPRATGVHFTTGLLENSRSYAISCVACP